MIYGFLIAFGCGLALLWPGLWLLRKLHTGQQVREELPSQHAKKAGTPTMGGAIFVVAATISSFLLAKLIFTVNDSSVLWWQLYGLWTFGIIGFADDFIKVVLHNPYGLPGRWTVILQLLVSIPFIWFNFGRLPGVFGNPWIDSVFYLVVIIAVVNAVNLADGLDGLATGATLITFSFMLPLIFAGNSNAVPATVSIIGALAAFLIINFKPAKCWMGNLGSNALGGLMVFTAIYMGNIWFFAVGIGLFIIENLSVTIQVSWFKYTKYCTRERVGKRIFLFTPIHHHFEKLGWPEVRIVVIFWFVSAFFGALMLALFYLL